ncbi:MAG: serine/threonine protein kinase [Acidobacteria bacterium]|nr:serine/threonine protein kinase [Acidobacteriota bacterium]MDW7983654.1 serine/threonine-protein kinase [Acidobacteriota bacterium]
MSEREGEAVVPERIGKYVIRRLLGQGGMGRVYHAYDPLIGRDVAIKVMLPEMAQNPDLKERFIREAQAAGHLRHPNIVTIHDLGEEAGVPYIVMEYLEGEDLDDLIRRRAPLSVLEKLDIIRQVCDALGYAHARGIVHRDIKPANIRLLEGRVPKVMDFGIAKVGTTHLTQTGLTVGTPHYMAPEQIRGERDRIDGRTDIFALGAVLYELLFYRRPFEGDHPLTVFYKILSPEPADIPDVPALPYNPDIRSVLARALAKDPEERYPSAYDMEQDLVALIRRLGEWHDQTTQPVASAVAAETGGMISGVETAVVPGPTSTPSEVSIVLEPAGRTPGRQAWLRWVLLLGSLLGLGLGTGIVYQVLREPAVVPARESTPQATESAKTTPATTSPVPASPSVDAHPTPVVLPPAADPTPPAQAAGETPEPLGTLDLNVLPWAEVLSIRRVSDGWSPPLPKPSYTPLRMPEVRTGVYEVQVRHPRLDRPVTFRVAVEAGKIQKFTYDLQGVVLPEVP